MYLEIVCYIMIIFIAAIMFYWNATTVWDYTNSWDWVIVIVANVSAIALCGTLIYTLAVKLPLD